MPPVEMSGGKRPRGNVPGDVPAGGGMSLGEVSMREVSMGEVSRGKCPGGKCPDTI